MDTTKLLGLQVAGPKDRASISEVTGNFNLLDQYAESWNGFSNTGTVEAQGTDFTIKPLLKIATELFSLTVKMPRAFAEDDTITVDDVVYNLYQGTDPALSEAWKAGEVVTINFDKTSRRCWASAGGGAPRPLPAQVSNMQASTPEGETPTIVFTWTNPVDENFAGMILVVKEGSAPNGVTDGTFFFNVTGTTFIYTEGVQWERTYYGRGFAYNSQDKFQMDATGAIASATPSDVPNQVSDLVLTPNKSSATLTWTNPTQQSYSVTKVIQKIDSDPENPNDGTEVYSGTDTTVTVSGLQDSINYHFAVFAISKSGKYKPPVVKTYTPEIWPKYDYTGQHTLIKDNAELGNWRIKLLSSGVLTWTGEKTNIDAFSVGGGGGSSADGFGGCGGFTQTEKGIELQNNQIIQVQVGTGGTCGFGNNTSTITGTKGGASSFGEYCTANGGDGGPYSSKYNPHPTVRGGCGGGAFAKNSNSSNNNAGAGGSDGGNGGNANSTYVDDSGDWVTTGGYGQGTTTREFGDAGADLYSGGGGGGVLAPGNSKGRPGAGGSGTPVLATSGGTSGTVYNNPKGGSAGGGYGGGGGGTWNNNQSTVSYGHGAQGIVIIRNART